MLPGWKACIRRQGKSGCSLEEACLWTLYLTSLLARHVLLGRKKYQHCASCHGARANTFAWFMRGGGMLGAVAWAALALKHFCCPSGTNAWRCWRAALRSVADEINTPDVRNHVRAAVSKTV